eukprot:GDKI01019713.1.p1 GENE.GDKI01019713.1~~GDKI01019713.1.p1  ORF type:complete len:320 (+),score=42.71 GDKI01019713.1:87-962(+)
MRFSLLAIAVSLLATSKSDGAVIRSHTQLASQLESKGTPITILSAFYGRTENGVVCPNSGSDDVPNAANGGCTKDVTAKVQSMFTTSDNVLQGGANLNNFFGEPCAGTHKYLSITYKCAGDPTETTWYRRAVRCAGSDKDFTLDCTLSVAWPVVIRSATFGLSEVGDWGKCGAPAFSTNPTCQVDVKNKLANVLARPSKKNTIPGGEYLKDIFALNPCTGDKYLTVTYYCGADVSQYYTAKPVRCGYDVNDYLFDCYDPNQTYTVGSNAGMTYSSMTKTSSSSYTTTSSAY